MLVQRSIRGLLVQATLIGVLLQTGTSSAQWVQTTGPRGGSVRSMLAVPDGAAGTHLFAGQIFVWRTADQGASWTRFGSGLSDPNVFALLAVPNGSGGHDIVAGTNAGVFRSTNQGVSWNGINNGITNLSVYALASGPNGSGGTNLYAGTYLGNAFRSTDNGASWTAISSGLPAGQANVNALITTTPGTVLAGTMDGIYRSTNFGASWSEVFNLFAFAFARHGSTLYAGTSNGVYRSTNDGASWSPINTGMGFTWVRAVAAVPTGSGVTLFAGAGGVLRSTDNGASWTPVNNGLGSMFLLTLTTVANGSGTDVYAGTSEGIFRTTNNGNSWTNVSFIYSGVQDVKVTPNGSILAPTENDIFRSNDAGANWTDTQANTTILDLDVNLNGAQGVSIFGGSSPSGVVRSTDDGQTWGGSSNGLDDFDVNSVGVIPNGLGGSNVLAGTYSELFISTNDGASWGKANLQTLTLDYVVTPNGSGGHNVFAGGFGGVWRSTNYGTAWTPVNAGLTDKVVQGMAATANGANLFACGMPFGVFRSTNDGATWTLVNDGLTDLRVVSLFSPDGTHLFAAGAGGVHLSTDHGNHWSSVSTGLTTGASSLALSTDGSTLFAGTLEFGVWKRPLSEMIDAPPPPLPTITSFAPAGGEPGIEVTITGSNFGGATAVRFNGVTAFSYTVVSNTEVRAIVPAGATTGRITVATAAGIATSSTDFIVTVPPPPSTLLFIPAHDAYVRSTSPSSNFGSSPDLRIRGGSQTFRSYLKFNVSGVTGTIQSATLRLRVKDGGTDGGSLFATSNNLAGSSTPWTESTLRWNNAPAPSGTALDVAGAVNVGAWIELDVTSAITGNGTFSFALTSSSTNVVDYSSSEGANPPELVVVMMGAVAQRGGAAGSGVAVPVEVMLHANRPNPFHATTTIHYTLPQTTSVRLVIYDITGRMVKTLVDGVQSAGNREATWNGRDDRGLPVGSGMYVYRLEGAGMRLTRKMSLMR